MPKKIKLMPHLSTAELGNRYRQARDPVERSHYQIVWLIAQGKSTAEVMEVTGYSRDWIQQLRSEEHTSELQSRQYLVCRLLLEKKKNRNLEIRRYINIYI